MVTALTAPKMYIMLLLMPFTISGRTSVKVLEAMSIDPATWNAGDLRATNTPAYNTPAVAHRAACDGKDLSWIEPGDLRGKEHVRWGHAEGHISKTCCQPRGSEDKSIDMTIAAAAAPRVLAAPVRPSAVASRPPPDRPPTRNIAIS